MFLLALRAGRLKLSVPRKLAFEISSSDGLGAAVAAEHGEKGMKEGCDAHGLGSEDSDIDAGGFSDA
jgi:hypothetical protein